MPLLAAFIGSVLFAVIEFFAKWLTKRLAILAAVVVGVTAFTAAFVGAMKALVAGIVIAVPAPVVIGASWVLPYNTQACIAVVLAAHVLRWVYDWNVKVIQYKLV